MTNDYRIVGDKAYITLAAKRGIEGTYEVIIDACDLPVAQSITGAWFLFIHQRTGKYYARGNDYVDQKLKQPMLHRLIAKPVNGQIVTHIDGNTLNCTRANMINVAIGTKEDKLQELLAARREAEAEIKIAVEPVVDIVPLKGVSLHKVKNKYEVSPFYEGKRYRLGYWPPDQLAEANRRVTEFRNIGPIKYFEKYPKRG